MAEGLSPLAALTWLVDEGADEATLEAPVNRFATQPVPFATPRSRPAPLNATPAALPPREGGAVADPVSNAHALAATADSLDTLKAALEGFDSLALKRGAQHTVFADGNPASRIMLIGEAPGADEDRIGTPFVGRAGRLLDKMLAAAGLDRSKVYITNVLNWRPPGNREPTPEEAAACLPFLRRHIELVDPNLIVLLGAVATHHVMGISEGIMRLRGRWLEYRLGTRMVPALPTLHPAYLLRQPAHKKLAWRDLLAVQDAIMTNRLLEGLDAIG